MLQADQSTEMRSDLGIPSDAIRSSTSLLPRTCAHGRSSVRDACVTPTRALNLVHITGWNETRSRRRQMMEHLTEYHRLSLHHSRSAANRRAQSVTRNTLRNEESTRCSGVPLVYPQSENCCGK
jgi:hypothetical protein